MSDGDGEAVRRGEEERSRGGEVDQKCARQGIYVLVTRRAELPYLTLPLPRITQIELQR
jgi:hypothetical protein